MTYTREKIIKLKINNKPVEFIVQNLLYHIDFQCFSAQKKIKNRKQKSENFTSRLVIYNKSKLNLIKYIYENIHLHH